MSSDTAGQRLRRDLDAALVHAAKEHGPIEFDEVEQMCIDRAVNAADPAEQLQRLFDEELAGQGRSSVLTRLSSEARHLDRTTVELVCTGPPVWARHPKAKARGVCTPPAPRWDRTPRHTV